MTIQEFIETRPQSFGRGNANLLYSSSVSGSDDTPIAPFTLQGLTIPFSSLEGVNVSTAFKEVNEIKFEYPTGTVTAEITGKQQRNEYYYFTFKNVVVQELPSSLDSTGNTEYENSDFVFVPYATSDFKNNDYNPLINNSEGSKRNAKVRKVDRFADALIPTNLEAIISESAEFAEIQNCSYTKIGITNGRYVGTKSTGAGPLTVYNKQSLTETVENNIIAGNDPAQNYKGFDGSTHPNDADTATIKDIQTSDRDVVEIYFNSVISGTHPNKTFPNFPSSGSFLYTEDGNRLVRLVNSKVYSIDKGEVFTTNDLGGVTTVE